MPPYGPEPDTNGSRRQRILAGAFIAAALIMLYLPAGAQQGIAFGLRATALRPFIATQRSLADARLRSQQVEVLQARLDSLAAVLSTRGALAGENRSLRALLDLSDRVGPSFRPASILRPGTPESESLFYVDLGIEDGVDAGSAVIDRHGLVGVILQARSGTSVGMDWTHPDFRASATLSDGSGVGVVETERGDFREEDRLVLNGTAYYQDVPSGVVVVTSGLGGIYPRGIPIGAVQEVADSEGRWRKSYWLSPMVHPAAVTHVLVEVTGGVEDLSVVWPVDSVLSLEEAVVRDRARADSLQMLRRLLGVVPADSTPPEVR